MLGPVVWQHCIRAMFVVVVAALALSSCTVLASSDVTDSPDGLPPFCSIPDYKFYAASWSPSDTLHLFKDDQYYETNFNVTSSCLTTPQGPFEIKDYYQFSFTVQESHQVAVVSLNNVTSVLVLERKGSQIKVYPQNRSIPVLRYCTKPYKLLEVLASAGPGNSFTLGYRPESGVWSDQDILHYAIYESDNASLPGISCTKQALNFGGYVNVSTLILAPYRVNRDKIYTFAYYNTTPLQICKKDFSPEYEKNVYHDCTSGTILSSYDQFKQLYTCYPQDNVQNVNYTLLCGLIILVFVILGGIAWISICIYEKKMGEIQDVIDNDDKL